MLAGIRLHKEAASAAARIINATPGRLNHLDQRIDNRFGSVEFTPALAFGRREFADEVFVDVTDQVEILITARQPEIGEQVHQAQQHAAIHAFPAVDLGQRPLQAFVIGLDRAHGIVKHHADPGAPEFLRQGGPPRLFRHPEDVFGKVFIAVFRIRTGVFGQLVMKTLKRFRNMPQEDHPERHMLVFAGVHVAPHLVRCGEKGCFDAHPASSKYVISCRAYGAGTHFPETVLPGLKSRFVCMSPLLQHFLESPGIGWLSSRSSRRREAAKEASFEQGSALAPRCGSQTGSG